MNEDERQNTYNLMIKQVSALTSNESDFIANMANISAVLYHGLSDVNWAGFYIFKENQLVLGPFQGNPACIRIPIGSGVCGAAAKLRTTQIIDDVHKYPGHIACDANSNSEIVIPILINEQLIGVLDIDSPNFSRFDALDAEYLSKVVDILISRILPETLKLGNAATESLTSLLETD